MSGGIYDMSMPADRLRYALNSITVNLPQRLELALGLETREDRVKYANHVGERYGEVAKYELIGALKKHHLEKRT